MAEDLEVDRSASLGEQVRCIGLDEVAYLPRRCADPHTVADLAADTFVLAIDSAGRFDPKRGRAAGGGRLLVVPNFALRFTSGILTPLPNASVSSWTWWILPG
jgi:hypothetical protein